MLFLHGWPSNAHLWCQILERLASYQRSIAIDLPGFGASDKPLDASYGPDFSEEMLEAALVELGVSELRLCVHDLGSPVDLYWAVQRPERISQLCLRNTLIFEDMSWAARLAESALQIALRWSVLTRDFGLSLGLRVGVKKSWYMDSDARRRYQEPLKDRESRRVLATTITGFTRDQMRVIYGEADRALRDLPGTMTRLKELPPHTEVTSLPGVVHFLQEDAPDEVADPIAEFFRR